MAKNLPLKRTYGLIGYPVKHSFSPAMHNAAFQALNINAEYKLFEVEPNNLEGFLLKKIEVKDTKGESFFSQDILGFNITIPHKVRASEILLGETGIRLIRNIATEKDHYVFLSGAINTIKREHGKVDYRNTDAGGFIKSLAVDLQFNPEGKNIFVLGCGGAGRAIVAALTWKEIKKIYLYDTNQDAIKSARQRFDRFSHVRDKLEYVLEKGELSRLINECQLLVNASPVGMNEGDGSAIDRKLFHKDLFVYDIVYNRETQLIKDAKLSGLPATGGLGMLLYQGVEAFELWTGKKAPVEVMRKALTEAMNK